MNAHGRRFLVYSSVGDNSDFPRHWLDSHDDREWDLWITYYGSEPEGRWSEYADRYFVNKGDKFSNFRMVFESVGEEITCYEAVMLIDCDIEIGTHALNELFAIREAYDLKILQPSFTNDSRISHPVTAQIPGALLHFTNFIEMAVPLFSRDALARFMEEFDDRLVGWGNDFLYMWANGTQWADKYAVIDSIACRNPRTRGRRREIESLGAAKDRAALWRQVAGERNIGRRPATTHSVLYAERQDSIEAGRGRDSGLHTYPMRSCSLESIALDDSGGVFSRSGYANGFRLNPAAMAVLDLCNGGRTVVAITRILARAFGWRAEDMHEMLGTVKQSLESLRQLGLVRFHAAAIPMAGEVRYQQPSPRTLAPGLVPRSIQVINLDSRGDRWRQTRSFLKAADVPSFLRLPAVAADDFDDVSDMLATFGHVLHEKYRSVPSYDPVSRRFKAKTGCALSHAKALKNVAGEKKAGWHLVLEDDSRICYGWDRFLDNFSDTLREEPQTEMILLGDRIGIAAPLTGIKDRLGTCAYAIHSDACDKVLATLDFTAGTFCEQYSLDNHFRDLCQRGILEVTVLENGPWTSNFSRRDSDIENAPRAAVISK